MYFNKIADLNKCNLNDNTILIERNRAKNIMRKEMAVMDSNLDCKIYKK